MIAVSDRAHSAHPQNSRHLETIVAVQKSTNPNKSYRLHRSPQSKIKVSAMLSERERKGAKISQVARFLDFLCISLFVSCKLHSRSISSCWRCFPLQTELKRRRRESKIRRELVMQGITDEAMPSTSQLYRGFRKWRYSYHRIIENLIKWMIWGYQYLRKLTYSLWIYISLAAMEFTLKMYWWC